MNASKAWVGLHVMQPDSNPYHRPVPLNNLVHKPSPEAIMHAPPELWTHGWHLPKHASPTLRLPPPPSNWSLPKCNNRANKLCYPTIWSHVAFSMLFLNPAALTFRANIAICANLQWPTSSFSLSMPPPPKETPIRLWAEQEGVQASLPAPME